MPYRNSPASYAHSVLKSWMYTLPYRMQSVLMSSLRGCDTAKKDDPSKSIQRALRGVILNNADPSNTFIVGEKPSKLDAGQFLWDIDAYPMHYVMHTAHAAEIIGYKHPEKHLRKWWIEFYRDICKGFHLNFETEEQLDIRLGYTPEEKGMLKTAEEGQHQWDAGTGTSHGGRDREYSGSS